MKTSRLAGEKGIKDKTKIAAILQQMASLLEMKGEIVFKVRAFENASRSIESASQELDELIQTETLCELKGIGKGIEKVISDLYRTGNSKEYDALRKSFPEGLYELFEIPGIGAKRIKTLYEKLQVGSVGELEYACTENRLIDLEGFGVKTQQKILENIQRWKKQHGYFLIDFAKEEAGKMLAYLKKQKGVLRVEVAGSIRRHKEIIRDMDLLVTAKSPAAVHKAFCAYPEVEAVSVSGETKSSMVLKSGIPCDLRTVSEEEFATALYYFTGSKEHSVAARTLAKKKGIKVNEYGLFRGKRKIACPEEKDIFETLGLHYIPPELRENQGEIEWAMKKALPALVQEKDIRGVFHVHSYYSDGNAPLETMVREAEKKGYEYIGISDHSQSAKYASGLTPDRVKEQWREIDSLQKKVKIRIFKGIESDILADGALDYPDSILAGFDFVIGSIHSRFGLPEKEMTERIRRAMDNRFMTFWGHPTGRLLLGREGYPVLIEKLIDEASAKQVTIELNANPHRLDLDWKFLRYAKQKEVMIGIHPDAHSIKGIGDVAYGVGIARKGWLEARNISNALPLSQMEKFLLRRR